MARASLELWSNDLDQASNSRQTSVLILVKQALNDSHTFGIFGKDDASWFALLAELGQRGFRHVHHAADLHVEGRGNLSFGQSDAWIGEIQAGGWRDEEEARDDFVSFLSLLQK